MMDAVKVTSMEQFPYILGASLQEQTQGGWTTIWSGFLQESLDFCEDLPPLYKASRHCSERHGANFDYPYSCASAKS